VLVAAQPPDGKLRCGVICGKKFSRKAVERNRARRILWESFRMLKPEMTPCHMVLIARKYLAGIKQQEAQSDMKKLLKQANLLTT
jgi:ribonuclease P protein component